MGSPGLPEILIGAVVAVLLLLAAWLARKPKRRPDERSAVDIALAPPRTMAPDDANDEPSHPRPPLSPAPEVPSEPG